jgi:hypothetical protein
MVAVKTVVLNSWMPNWRADTDCAPNIVRQTDDEDQPTSTVIVEHPGAGEHGQPQQCRHLGAKGHGEPSPDVVVKMAGEAAADDGADHETDERHRRGGEVNS